jgi:hypothetical protein
VNTDNIRAESSTTINFVEAIKKSKTKPQISLPKERGFPRSFELSAIAQSQSSEFRERDIEGFGSEIPFFQPNR